MTPQERLRQFAADPKLAELATDIAVAIAFYTRLPWRPTVPVGGPELARAIWASPIAGALIGLGGALVYWIAFRLKVPPIPAAALAIAATLLLTGALHEDGLADVADGFGGGDTREQKLEIMRDSRIGTYGVIAVAMSLILRVGALSEIAQVSRSSAVIATLIATHAAARGFLPAVMFILTPARRDGLLASAGQPAGARVAIAFLLGALLLVLGLGIKTGLAALLLAVIAMSVLAWIAVRQIGGQTGDVLGAQEQVVECTVLVVAAAALG